MQTKNRIKQDVIAMLKTIKLIMACILILALLILAMYLFVELTKNSRYPNLVYCNIHFLK